MDPALFLLVLSGSLAVASGPAQSTGDVASRGGGPAELASCLTDAERALVRSLVARRSPLLRPGTPPRFTFHPLAGTLYGDVFPFHFADLQPGGGIRDWDCTRVTFDGHPGNDIALRGFGELALGVPVFAALDGLVISTFDDGEDGVNTSCATGFANHVAIDHGNGRLGFYWHLKKDSVLVTVGQFVRAGEQVGSAGSSGDCTPWPHLHLEVHDDGQWIEPYAGACRPGASQWTNQTPIERSTYAWDFNLTDVEPSDHPGLPFDMPRTGTFVQGPSQRVAMWILIANRPGVAERRIRFLRPDGTSALDSTGVLGNGMYPFFWRSWRFFVDLDVTGTWRVLFDVDGATLVDAPFEVVPAPELIVNRPPYPITVELEPPHPSEASVLTCRVQTDLVLDDPDYDVVRYRYMWTVDGAVRRDVTTAAHSDVFPRLTAPAGARVECTVTASDGTDAAPPVTDGVEIHPAGRLTFPLVLPPLLGPVPVIVRF